MLPVFNTFPCTSPSESMGFEETVGQVGRRYLTREVGRAVDIPCCRGRLYDDTSGTRAAVAGVVEGVQVHGHTARVGGEPAAAFDDAIAESTGIIGAHRQLIVGPKVIDKSYALYGIAMEIELTEDIQDIGGNGFVADHLAKADMPLEVFMQQTEIAKVGTAHATAFRIAPAFHTGEDCVGDRSSRETARQTIGFHSLGTDDSAGTPRRERSGGGDESCHESEQKGSKKSCHDMMRLRPARTGCQSLADKITHFFCYICLFSYLCRENFEYL